MKKKAKLKKMDELHQHLLDGALLFKLSNEEVAALLTSIMRNILTMEDNRKRLEKMNIKVEDLSTDNVLTIQKLLTEGYLEEYNKNNPHKAVR